MVKTTILDDIDVEGPITAIGTAWSEIASKTFTLLHAGKFFLLGSCEYTVDTPNGGAAINIKVNGIERATDAMTFPVANIYVHRPFFTLISLNPGVFTLALNARASGSTVTVSVRRIQCLPTKY